MRGRRTSWLDPVRPYGVALAAGAIVLIGVVLAVDPLATWRTRRELAALEGMHGSFDDVDVDLLRLSLSIRGLRIDKVGQGGARVPFIDVERASFRLHGMELLAGHAIASADLEAPRLRILGRSKPGPSPSLGAPRQLEEAPEEGRDLTRAMPFAVDRAQVRRGEILLARASAPQAPVLRLHGIELALERPAAGPAPGERPTVLSARATLQRTGKVAVFATIDPDSEAPTFAGEGKLTALQFVELAEIVSARSSIEPASGVLDMFVRFEARDGRLSGEVRSILKNARTRPAEGEIVAEVKSVLVDTSLDVLRDDVLGGGDVAATTIPIAGAVKDPDARPVPTIIGVLRNAFVSGLTAALRGPPSPDAKARARRGASSSSSPRQ